MKLLTNPLMDFIVPEHVVQRISSITHLSSEKVIEFLNRICNSDKITSETMHVNDLILCGDFLAGGEWPKKESTIALGVFSGELSDKTGYDISAYIIFHMHFFEIEDDLYGDLSKEINLPELDYPYVYVSKISDKSYITYNNLNVTAPFEWFFKNEILNIFNVGKPEKDLLLLNFGEA